MFFKKQFLTDFVFSLLPRNVEQFLHLSYLPTYQHAPAFIVGLITANLLLNRPSMIKNANKGALSFIWLLLISIALLIFTMPFIWENFYRPSSTQSALYAALHRPLFILLIAYISFTSISGSAGTPELISERIFTCDVRIDAPFLFCFSRLLWSISLFSSIRSTQSSESVHLCRPSFGHYRTAFHTHQFDHIQQRTVCESGQSFLFNLN